MSLFSNKSICFFWASILIPSVFASTNGPLVSNALIANDQTEADPGDGDKVSSANDSTDLMTSPKGRPRKSSVALKNKKVIDLEDLEPAQRAMAAHVLRGMKYTKSKYLPHDGFSADVMNDPESGWNALMASLDRENPHEFEILIGKYFMGLVENGAADVELNLLQLSAVVHKVASAQTNRVQLKSVLLHYLSMLQLTETKAAQNMLLDAMSSQISNAFIFDQFFADSFLDQALAEYESVYEVEYQNKAELVDVFHQMVRQGHFLSVNTTLLTVVLNYLKVKLRSHQLAEGFTPEEFLEAILQFKTSWKALLKRRANQGIKGPIEFTRPYRCSETG